MNTPAFAFQALRREWRAGELRVLAVALIIAVASVTAVGFFTDRTRQAMQQQASELLAADLVVVSPDKPKEAWSRRARQLRLAQVETLSFVSVVLANGKPQLAEVKAVSPGYPLRGRLRTATRPFAADTPTDAIPPPGTLWLDPYLMNLLSVSVGDTVHLGAAELTVGRVLTYEPDRGGSLFSIAPRLLMNAADIPGTKLLQPGSRVRYRLLLAGEQQDIAAFRTWMAPYRNDGVQLQDVREARPEMRAALERAEQFLGLASLVSVMLAGVAVATSARRHATRHLNSSAIMRCLGATQAFITRLYLLQMAILGLAASLFGCLLGYVAQFGLAYLLSGLITASLPAASFFPFLLGGLTGLVMLLGFALPPLLRLRDVSPARVLRRDIGPLPPHALTAYAAAVAAVSALMVWHIRDLKLTAYVWGATAATLLILGAAAHLLITGLQPLRRRAGAWRFGLANIARRAEGSVAQILAFGLGIMVLLLLSVVRADLLADWKQGLPPDAPNYFLINIQKAQLSALQRFFNQNRLHAPQWHPMVRARLIAVNGREIRPADFRNERARRLVEREFNLSWSEQPPPDNRIVAGTWWTPAEKILSSKKGHDNGNGVLSLEQGLAETLGLKLGDSLTYRIAGEDLRATVANLRAVKWDSFQVNFFVLAPPGLLEDFPATYITSFYLAAENKTVLSDLVKQFPNITVIDVDAIMVKVRQVMNRVTRAVQYLFLFTLLSGLVVLYAAIQATQDERMIEAAILRTLGASQRQLWSGLTAEFAVLGLLAGCLAALSASLVGYLLAARVFDVNYHFDPWLWLIGPVGGALGVGIAGLIGVKSVLQQPPLATLRRF